MKKFGAVKNVTHDGSILLKASETPKPGTRVYDSRGVEVGRVSRVFGPVREPYVSVRPKGAVDSFGLLGSSLYMGAEEPDRPDKPRGSFRAVKNRGPGRGRAPPGKRYGAHVKKKGVNKRQRKEKPQRK